MPYDLLLKFEVIGTAQQTRDIRSHSQAPPAHPPPEERSTVMFSGMLYTVVGTWPPKPVSMPRMPGGLGVSGDGTRYCGPSTRETERRAEESVFYEMNHLSKKDNFRWVDVFKKIDRDGNGRITEDELRSGCKELYVDLKEEEVEPPVPVDPMTVPINLF